MSCGLARLMTGCRKQRSCARAKQKHTDRGDLALTQLGASTGLIETKIT
jgi:hypothetical protein